VCGSLWQQVWYTVCMYCMTEWMPSPWMLLSTWTAGRSGPVHNWLCSSITRLPQWCQIPNFKKCKFPMTATFLILACVRVMSLNVQFNKLVILGYTCTHWRLIIIFSYMCIFHKCTHFSLSQHTHLLMNIHRTARLMSGGGLQGDNLAGMMWV